MNAANESLRAVTFEALSAPFEKTFSIEMAQASDAIEKVCRVRHKVFCEELGFDMASQQGQEMDPYDSHSLHVLLRHRASGIDTGCVRLVLPRPREGGGLPFEEYGVSAIDRSKLDFETVDPKSRCEISRLAVVSNFRRRLGEENNPEGISEVEETPSYGVDRQFPFIAISLYHAAIALVLNSPLDYVFMTIEPRLARHLRRYGVNLVQISEKYEYCGTRATFYTTRERFMADVKAWKPEWQGLYNNVHWQLFGRDSEHVHFPVPS